MTLFRGWEAVIGLEVHAQLKTVSKLFSPCPLGSDTAADGAGEGASGDDAWLDVADASLAINRDIDPLTLGLPGTLPVVNARAVELAVRLGLALGCRIDRASRFARKHYFYPDLPKGYQISQYERPICVGGAVEAVVGGERRRFRLNRIHIEEDAGKTVHDARAGVSRVDYNRAGTPLVEIVGEPDLRSPEEAVAYLKSLHQTVVWLGVCDGHMEAGNFRCDANVSVRRPGEPLGTRTEIKNVNSFRFVELAIASEIERQIAALEAGQRIVQETRGWDEARGTTRSLRSKEDAHDYRYFDDPDLLPLHLQEAYVENIAASLPELPLARATRFEQAFGVSAYDAEVLVQSRDRADFFEEAARVGGDGKLAANWVINDLLGALARQEKGLDASPVSASALGELVALLREGALNSKLAKECFAAMMVAETPISPRSWAEARGGQLNDAGAIAAAIEPILDRNPAQVEQYLAGKDKVFGFFVGQVMRETKGRANPDELQRILKERLEARRT
jgi:aspartyl-tRNA(Asn)/glutamyl-tRNA(Gln) amidotransferase subunit B